MTVAGPLELPQRATQDQLAQFKQAILQLSLKLETLVPPPNFYCGPFQSVEPFLNWIKSLEVFFDTKGVLVDEDKVRILGGLSQEANNLLHGQCFLTFGFFMVFLAIQPSSMGNWEAFNVYSTRAHILRTMINFEKETVSDFDLSEAVTFGLKADLKIKLHDFQLLLVSPFKYSTFEQRVIYRDVPLAGQELKLLFLRTPS
ncbi:hypothetical protein VP01_4449g1 [Puccinia sorghi]|uniref:Uncharacterized protein n=1 Tax=Puccinia sorghi TaxID=27349 RepID=A0A0L6UPE1_9BASI|nr:hypothetical protein VP01_4449g1 [Puccinia sorghi]